MHNFLTKISKTLDKLTDKICIIDVGYHKGHFIQSFIRASGFTRKRLKVYAIDPIDYRVTRLRDKFFNLAVSNYEGTSIFHTYDEPGCNSICRMRIENLKNSQNEDGWYCAYKINKTGEFNTKVTTLDSIIENHVTEPIIHFLKIDAQGNDINVIKGANSSLEKIMFIEVESCVAEKESEIMYDGQTTILSDIDYMRSIDFEVLDIERYTNAPPEANMLFYNKRYTHQLSSLLNPEN